MNLVMALSDHIFVLHRGRLLFAGHARSRCRHNPDVQEAYLGSPGRASTIIRAAARDRTGRSPATGGREILHGISAELADGRDRRRSSGPMAPARRRCSTPSRGLATSTAATIRFKGEDITGLRPDTVVAPRHQPLPGGPPHLPAADRRGKPDRRLHPRPGRSVRRAARPGLRAVPGAGRAAQRAWPAGSRGGQQQMLAVARALMARAAPADARRAVAGPGAEAGQPDPRDHPEARR